MTEHEQGAEIAAAVGATAGSTITRAEIVDDWLLALTSVTGPVNACSCARPGAWSMPRGCA